MLPPVVPIYSDHSKFQSEKLKEAPICDMRRTCTSDNTVQLECPLSAVVQCLPSLHVVVTGGYVERSTVGGLGDTVAERFTNGRSNILTKCIRQ